MIHLRVLLLILTGSTTMWVQADDSYMDVDQRLNAFAEELGQRLEADAPVSSSQVAAQLQPNKTKAIAHTKPSTETLTGAALYQARSPSVVMLGKIYKCDRCDHWHSNVASGFIIHADGIIVTNYHVVEHDDDDDAIAVMTHDGTLYEVEEVLACNRANDLAVLKINAKNLIPAPIASEIGIGAPVSVISHPARHLYTYTEGIVSGKTRQRHKKNLRRELTITADFAKGSSGAPVFDQTGAVVGIVRATETVFYDEHRGMDTNPQMVWKFAIPSECLLELIETQTKE
ncbi:MAG: serine protease Do [Kiritimatiellia bacterium]|jgi:serine protease Do